MKKIITLPALICFFTGIVHAQTPSSIPPVAPPADATQSVTIDFQAVYTNGKVMLSWVGKQDCCSEYYVIERSRNGVDFTQVRQVAGPKTSCPYTEYFETDQEPISGSSFYRLRMVTREGVTQLSNTIPVNLVFNQEKGIFTTTSGGTENGNLKIELKGFEKQEVLVVLMDKEGKVILSKVHVSSGADNFIAVSTDGTLPPGEYIVTASSKNEIFSQKIVVN